MKTDLGDQMSMTTIAEQLDAVSERFSELVAPLSDEQLDAAAQGTPTWTVREVIAHVGSVPTFYRHQLDGLERMVDIPRDLDAANQRRVDERIGRPPLENCEELRTAARELCELLGGLEADHQIPFHAGTTITPAAIAAVVVEEVNTHGLDIARTAGRPWTIDRADALLAWRAMAPLLGGWVDPDTTAGHTATYELRLRGGDKYRFAFVDGELSEPASDKRANCVIWGDPVEMMKIMFRRSTPLRATLTGKALAWGTRPWLAFSFGKRFQPV